jgi:hypothetical protein
MHESPTKRSPSTEDLARYFIVLAPLALLVFLTIAAPRYLQWLYDPRVHFAGLPLGVPIMALVGILVLMGLAIVHWVPGLAGAALASLVSTLPAVLLIAFGPALVQIVSSMATR